MFTFLTALATKGERGERLSNNFDYNIDALRIATGDFCDTMRLGPSPLLAALILLSNPVILTAFAADAPSLVAGQPSEQADGGAPNGTAPSATTETSPEPPVENPDVLDATSSADGAKDNAPTRLERARAALAQSRASALSDGEVCTTLIDVARRNALPVGFFTNLIWRESKFDHEAISDAGAMGIAQFMPDVADKLGLDAFNPRDALSASGRLLRTLLTRFKNLGLVAAAYNAGPKRVVDWMQQRATLPKETRDYVSIITGRSVDQWLGKLRSVAFNVPRQVPCNQSIAFVAAEQAERAAQLRKEAEEQAQLEKARESARQQKKRVGALLANRAIAGAARAAAAKRAASKPMATKAVMTRPASVRTSDKHSLIKRNPRAV